MTSAKTLLIVGDKGELKELKCPFNVYSVKPMKDLPAYRTVQVDEVFECPLYQIQFAINGMAYPYDIFRYVDDFFSKFKHTFDPFVSE